MGNDNIYKATHIVGQSLIYVNDVPTMNQPVKKGNDFFVKIEGQQQRKQVANMCHENLLFLQKMGVVDFPIQIEFVGERYCNVIDERVPDHFCK